MSIKPNPRQTFKALLFDYDDLLAQDDDECCYSLSARDIQLILAQSDAIGWKTRYKPTSTEIDQSLIDRWKAGLVYKLMSGCCPDDTGLHRFSETGVYQTSTDGGATWTDDPTGDPRNDGVELPPLTGEDGSPKRCAAADNTRDVMKVYREQAVSLLTAGTTVLAIIAALIGLLGVLLGLSGVAVGISVLLFGLAMELLSLTPTSVSDQLSDTVMDEFRCEILCYFDESGNLTYSQWVAMIAHVDSHFTGFPQRFFHAILAAMGYLGVNNAARTGPATASDCGDCDDCDTSCGANYDMQFGTYLGTFGGYRRYQSEVIEGTSRMSIIAPDVSTCCKLIDWRTVSPEGVTPIGYRVNCGDPIDGAHLYPNWTLEGCYNYLSSQLVGGDTRTYVVELLFADCG